MTHARLQDSSVELLHAHNEYDRFSLRPSSSVVISVCVKWRLQYVVISLLSSSGPFCPKNQVNPGARDSYNTAQGRRNFLGLKKFLLTRKKRSRPVTFQPQEVGRAKGKRREKQQHTSCFYTSHTHPSTDIYRPMHAPIDTQTGRQDKNQPQKSFPLDTCLVRLYFRLV